MMSLAAVAVAACEMLIPWLIAQAIDAALTHHDTKSLDLVGSAILLVVGALYVFHVLYLRAEVGVLYAATFRLRQLLYTRILDQPIGFFARAKSGELNHRVINDVEVLKAHGVYIFSELPFAVLTVVGVLTIMFASDWHLASMTFAFLLIAAAISAWLGRPLPTIRHAIQSLGASLSQRLTEAFAGIRTVKIFGLEDYEAQRLDVVSRAGTDHEIHEGRIGARVEPVLELMEMLGVVLIVWYGAHLIVDGRITPGILVAFIAYLELLSEPVSRSGRYYRHYLACRGIMERLATFVASLPRGLPRERGLWPTVAIDVVYEDVAFSYPGAGRHAIHGISFSARPNDIIAIVGRNGAGKSTLVDLLLRFWKPDSGRIRAGGVDLPLWSEAAWRATTGVMPQEVFLFHASLAENIAYGRPNAARAEVEKAAKLAGLEPLLQRLPQGLEAIVGDRGQKLSGGERQRVSLARVVLKDPRLIILDEPTAGLDGESLRALGETVMAMAKERLVFVIAHRIETVRLATHVLLLDQGRIVAEGTPEQLESSNDLFRSLFTDSRAEQQNSQLL